MGEVIVSNVAGRILSRLRSTAVKETVLKWGIAKELRNLETSVSSLRFVLLDAEDKQVNNRRVRNWLKKLEVVICEADIFVNDISTSAEALEQQLISSNKISKQVRTLFSSSKKFILRKKINKFKQMIDGIAFKRNFHLERSLEEIDVLSSLWKQIYPNFLQEEAMGRDQDRKRIVETLLDPKIKYKLSVIAIVGASGLGKTSLARLVFHDKEVQDHFELKMWVSASGVSNVTLLVAKIIQSATDEYPTRLERHQLQTNLQKQIYGKRYLLVLDDFRIEDEKLWQSLKEFLNHGAEGSKILITWCSNEDLAMMSVEALLDPKTKSDLSVTGILGIGGFGKTSLAWQFFHDKEIRNHFELKIWVSASDVSDMTLLVARILQAATNKYPENLEMHTLQMNVRKELYRKRYLLVIDDPRVKDHQLCQGLKELFIEDEKRSGTFNSAQQLWQSLKPLFSKSSWGEQSNYYYI